MKWERENAVAWGFKGLRRVSLWAWAFGSYCLCAFLSPKRKGLWVEVLLRDKWVLFMEVSCVLSSGLFWCEARWLQDLLPPPLKPHLPCLQPGVEVLLMQEILESVGRGILSDMAIHLKQGNILVKIEYLLSLALAIELHLCSQGLKASRSPRESRLVHEGQTASLGDVDTSQQHSWRTTKPHLLTMSFVKVVKRCIYWQTKSQPTKPPSPNRNCLELRLTCTEDITPPSHGLDLDGHLPNNFWQPSEALPTSRKKLCQPSLEALPTK